MSVLSKCNCERVVAAKANYKRLSCQIDCNNLTRPTLNQAQCSWGYFCNKMQSHYNTDTLADQPPLLYAPFSRRQCAKNKRCEIQMKFPSISSF